MLKETRRFRRLPAALFVAFALTSCQPKAMPAPPEGTPRLVVLIVVDQMRADFLDRYERFWQGGLRYLLDHSVRFTDAHHDHAITATAPGHATLASGCHPSRHGIFSNYWIDRDSGELVYSAADNDWEPTPERLACSTFGDWLKTRYPAARVFSVSAKDRSAILMGGHKADGAFFYDEEMGGWVSAEHYYQEEPDWVGEFNDLRLLDERFGKAWEPLPVSPADLEELGVVNFDMGPLEPDLPIPFGGLSPAPGGSFYEELFSSPWLDENMARFAEHLIGAEALGGDEIPDFLALGFAATDGVGHSYGPDSLQQLDNLRRLDATLGELFDFLDRRIGLGNVVLAFSADHGAGPVPEVRQSQGLAGRRTDTEDVLCEQRVYERLQGRFGEGAWLLPGTFVNREALAGAGVNYEDVESATAELITACPSVERVWTRTELAQPEAAADPMGRLFVNSFPPEVAPDFLVQREEFFLSTRSVPASHGTAWPYDTHVPLLVAAPGISPETRTARVRTVDLAPTLAALVAAEPSGEIDGVDLEPRPGSSP